ncbi:hypothetical protein TH66_12815 [Carbonactinospora thermoautotrophica]|uniref:Uncharacterized protein n=1 Tax=Carbonactinospora thermoautotrophica TaxID=1469144 RepID=A0A132N0K6_9ACTN|nr:hypothetical protein [Carbonactinospora thermoautotrophica]KWX03688.1 hypothetical protein TH66_12815 [Carbonactinospora thermoautotrophica]KWX09576.1 hypothetical protein TR74_08765 [Carbonactinospora thermoautotrophica]
MIGPAVSHAAGPTHAPVTIQESTRVIVTSTLGGPARPPRRPQGSRLLASVDVEWTKNYRVKNGNRPFCYSAVYLAVPTHGPVDVTELPFRYTSVYVENTDETEELIRLADAELRACLDAADQIIGHQLSSDLAVLANAAAAPPEAIETARHAWRARRDAELATRRVVDTRYDAGHILGCASRRLVDVCTDLGLDVTQPELRGTSMTALHRTWLETGRTEARERISVLNLRHSLSAALVALRATGRADWVGAVNVNRILAAGLDGDFGWLRSPTFAALL